MVKIAIVSDSVAVRNSIQSKLILLRDYDRIVQCGTAEIYAQSAHYNIILLHTPKIDDVTLTTISKLKTDTTAIILLVENVEPKLILEAYDLGINDFCEMNITNFELLIKIVNAQKNLNLQKKVAVYRTTLERKGCLKPNSAIFTDIKDIINPNFYADICNSTMLAFHPEEQEQGIFVLNGAENCLQLRQSDYLINYGHFKYLAVMPNTELEDGAVVFKKLCKKINLNLKGVIFKYNKNSPEDVLQKLERLEVKREEKGLNLLIEQEPEETWLDSNSQQNEPQNYKIFQNIFNNKIKKVVEPVFYRTKQKYERHFANTKIKYFTDNDIAEFMIINFDRTNSLKIIYKNSAKICVHFNYSGLEAPENKDFNLPFSKLTTPELTKILEEFINTGEQTWDSQTKKIVL